MNSNEMTKFVVILVVFGFLTGVALALVLPHLWALIKPLIHSWSS